MASEIRTCDVCMFFACMQTGDDEGEHHPACRRAPPTERNRFARMFESVPRQRDPKIDPAEIQADRRAAQRRFQNTSWGYCGPKR